MNHVYTLHRTYTGEHCALCGRPFSEHAIQDKQMVDGEVVNMEELLNPKETGSHVQ